MERACRIYEWVDSQPLELLPLLRELTTHVGFELDMQREARSADRVHAMFASDRGRRGRCGPFPPPCDFDTTHGATAIRRPLAPSGEAVVRG